MTDAVTRLEEAVRDRPGAARSPRRIPHVPVRSLGDPEALARVHDAALFLRAFPRTTADLPASEELLGRVAGRVAALAAAGADLSALDTFEAAGIAGTELTMNDGWGAARWLALRHPSEASLSWEGEPAEDRLAATLPRFLPFLAERALADNGVAFRAWLEAALPRGTRDGGLRFLVDAFGELPLDDAARAEIWDATGLLVRWRPGRGSRTFARLPSGRPFVDQAPLVPRRHVSVARECERGDVAVRRLSRREGEAFLESARAAVRVRYRELFAFTAGNPADAVVAELGRGLRAWCCGLLPSSRLPLRAGYGFLLARNGVPLGYGDAYALGKRLDLSFNVFYAFRDGESAFSYARTAAFFHRFLGTRTVSVDPYQVGAHNEEAVSSGAFWFYRKLGFRSADPATEALARREEARVLSRPGCRTPPATLRRLARAPLLLDLPGGEAGRWDRFSLDALGLAVQRRMAASRLDPRRFREACERRVARAAGLGRTPLPPRLAAALRGLAPVLDLLLALPAGRAVGPELLWDLVRAKAARGEAGYLKALGRPSPLRDLLSSFPGRPRAPVPERRARLGSHRHRFR